MAKYELVFKKSVSKDLRRLPKKDVARILKRINALSENPRPPGCEKLSGQERYRVRQGVYRIVYAISDQLLCVTIVMVDHRSEIYKR